MENKEFINRVSNLRLEEKSKESLDSIIEISSKSINNVKENKVNNLSNKELSSIRNSTVSFIFQHFLLIKEYSVYDNVELPLSFRKISKKRKKEIVLKYLKRLGIEDKVNKKLNQLSEGQRVIARAYGILYLI